MARCIGGNEYHLVIAHDHESMDKLSANLVMPSSGANGIHYLVYGSGFDPCASRPLTDPCPEAARPISWPPTLESSEAILKIEGSSSPSGSPVEYQLRMMPHTAQREPGYSQPGVT